MATIRYPYNKRPRPEWCEVPLDVTDRSAGTILVQLADLPREKFAYLQKTLDSAKRSFVRITAEQRAATRAGANQLEGSSESEIFRAIATVQKIEKMKPAVKRLLRHTLEDLARRTGEAQQTPEQAYLAELRQSAGHPLGSRVLAFAESLTQADAHLTTQAIEEAFAPRLSEAIRSMRAARLDLLRHGITNHKDLFGEITLDDGAPLLDDDGKPQVAPVPFEPGAWSWAGKKRAGCGEETLALYDAISETGGCLYALSEAVLLWNKGIVPTPALIWESWEKKSEAPAETDKEEEEAPAPVVSRDGDAPPENVVPFDAGE